MDDGRVGHCELAVDGARWMMSDEFESAGVRRARPATAVPAVTLHLTVDDVRRGRRPGRRDRYADDARPGGQPAGRPGRGLHRPVRPPVVPQPADGLTRVSRTSPAPVAGTPRRTARPRPREGRRPAGTPVTRGRSSRLHRSASPGAAGQEPMTRPAGSRPRARSAATVSSVWLSVPSPAATTTTTSAASRQLGEVEQGAAVGVEADEQPARPLDDHRVVELREHPDPVGVLRDRRDRLRRAAGPRCRERAGRRGR